MIPPRPTELAHGILRDHLRPGMTAIDATAGNGHDTVFLARLVAPDGRVIAFDIQSAALAATRARLEAAGLAGTVELHHESHSRMARIAGEGSADAIMFNLGYLPGENHETTTETGETLAALDAAEQVLKPGGILSIVCYPGHPGGDAEAQAVEEWLCARSAAGWRSARYGMLATRSPAPFLLIARKAPPPP